MKTVDHWLDEYGQSHKNEINQYIHKICVPTIGLSLLGILWLVPFPTFFEEVSYLNFATISSALILIFYGTLRSPIYFLGSLLMIILKLLIINFLVIHFGEAVIYGFFTLFVFSWIGQFIGHQIEGKSPSFYKDLIFLLIGPLWVLKSLFVKIGVTTSL